MRKIGRWAKRHPFWAFVVAWFLVSMLLDGVGVISGEGAGRILGLIIVGYLVLRFLAWMQRGLWTKKDKEMWEKDKAWAEEEMRERGKK